MTTKRRKTPAVSETSERPGGDIVPVPPLSSTRDGLSGVLPARTPEHIASARAAKGEGACSPAVTTRSEEEEVDFNLPEPPPGWIPKTLPRYYEVMCLQEVAYRKLTWIWEGEMRQHQMERKDWVQREQEWTTYAEGMEEGYRELEKLREQHKTLEEKYKTLEEKNKKVISGKGKGKKKKEAETQTEVEHRTGTVETQTEEEHRAGREENVVDMEMEEVVEIGTQEEKNQDRLAVLERSLERLVEVVALQGSSLDALGERIAKGMGEVHNLVRGFPCTGGFPPPIGGLAAPSLLSSVGAGASKEGRPAGDGGRGRKRRRGVGGATTLSPPPTPQERATDPTPVPGKVVRPPDNRGPPTAGTPSAREGPAPSLTTSAAVLIRGAEGFSYAEALRKAREAIPLTELGISGPSVRRAASGGLLVEIRGLRGGEQADALAGRLASLLPEASVSRPERSGEVRLVGFDESVLPDELARALAGVAGCGPESVRIGAFRQGARGRGVAWARLPLAAAATSARVGCFRVGWSTVRVEMLDRRPLQCFRCWGYGHLRAGCPSAGLDRGRACYRCGREGHVAGDCASAPRCIACDAAGLYARHRMGGAACEMARRARDGRGGRNGRRRGRPPAGGSASGGGARVRAPPLPPTSPQ